MSEPLNESQSPLQLHNNTLMSMGHLHTGYLSVALRPIRIDPLLNVSNGFVLPARFEQIPEPAPQLEYSSTGLRVEMWVDVTAPLPPRP